GRLEVWQSTKAVRFDQAGAGAPSARLHQHHGLGKQSSQDRYRRRQQTWISPSWLNEKDAAIFAERKGAVHDIKWAVQRARYMTLESLAPLSDDPLVSLPAVPAR